MNDFQTKVDLTQLHKFITEQGTPVAYRRGDVLCMEGSKCQVVGIVQSGYFQYSVINSSGENCITGFAFENEVVTDYVGSFLFNMPALTSICAGCDTSVIQIDIEEAKRYIARIQPDFNANTCSVLLVEAYRRYLDLHTKTPKERYVDLCTRCHGDLSRITLQEIASYLSISRRQLQRIRESMI